MRLRRVLSAISFQSSASDTKTGAFRKLDAPPTRGSSFTLKFKIGVADLAFDCPAIGQCEDDRAMRLHTKFTERCGRYQTVDNSRINQEVEAGLAPCPPALFDNESLICQSHEYS